MCSAYAGKRSAPCVGVRREVVRAGTPSAPAPCPRAAIVSTRSVGQAGAVLDAVDAGLDQPGQHGLPEAVGRHPCAVLVGRRDRVPRTHRPGTTGPGRPRHGRSSRRPASPSRRLPGPPARRTPAARPARSRGRSRGCSGGCARGGDRTGPVAAGRRAPGPTGCRQASRSRAAAASRRRGRRGPGCSVVASSTAPCSSSPRWQWASTRPGTIQPSRGRLGAGDRLEGDPPVDDVEVARLAVGQHRAPEPQRRHVPDATGSGRRATPGCSRPVARAGGHVVDRVWSGGRG